MAYYFQVEVKVEKVIVIVVMPETAKKGVLKNFAKFTEKYQQLRPATLLKKRIQHRCFSVNFAKFLGAPYFYSTPYFYSMLLQRVAFLVFINLGAVGWSIFYISYGGEAWVGCVYYNSFFKRYFAMHLNKELQNRTFCSQYGTVIPVYPLHNWKAGTVNESHANRRTYIRIRSR